MTDHRCPTFPSSFAPEAAAARIALINMNTDERGEAAFRALMPAGTQFYSARVGVDLQAYNEGRFELLGGFPFLAGALPPADRVDLIAFSCTSGTIAGGEAFVADGFAPTHPGIPCTNPATAAAAGLTAAGVRTIALLTPYPSKVHEKFPPYFAECGIEVVSDGSFDLHDDALVGRVDYASFLSAGRTLLADCKPDALFISCAAFDVVDKLESLGQELGLPVYSSSQLFAWHARQLLGIDRPDFPPSKLVPQSGTGIAS